MVVTVGPRRARGANAYLVSFARTRGQVPTPGHEDHRGGLVAGQAGAPVRSISDPTRPPDSEVGCATRLGCSSRHGCSRPDEAIVSLASITDEIPARGLGPYGAPRPLEMPSSSRMRTPLRGKDDFTLTWRSEPSRVSGSPMSSRARRPCVAPALRSELGCERAGQPAGRVFVDRSGSLEVCRL